MKKSKFITFIIAGIFTTIPAFLSANPLDVPSPESSSSNAVIKKLRAQIGYPAIALHRNLQGKFTMTVNVDESGKVTAVGFELAPEASLEELSPLIETVSKKLYAFDFGQDFAGQTVRIPFRFRL